MDLLNIAVDDGKYRIIQREDGSGEILRHEEPWMAPLCNVQGSKMILAMGYELERLRERAEKLEAAIRNHERVKARDDHATHPEITQHDRDLREPMDQNQHEPNLPVYRHYTTGGIYDVLSDTALIEATKERAVIYRCRKNGQVWVRPFVEFHALIDQGSYFAPRFERVTEIGKPCPPDDESSR